MFGTRAYPLAKLRSRQTNPADPAERACVAAAVDVYHNRLLADPRALRYVEARGLDHATVEACRLGFVAGDELMSYLRWLCLPIRAAIRAGVLGRDGREFLSGRIVVPEIREGQPLWLIGRTIDSGDPRPKYLGLPGRKPLLGWEFAAAQRDVWLVEGVFDYLALRSWGIPALALLGTHPCPEHLQALARFAHVYLLLDNDPAGRDGANQLLQHLGDRAVVVTLEGVNDVAELALRPDGRSIFSRLLTVHSSARAA